MFEGTARVPILTRAEIDERARRAPHPDTFEGVEVVALQQIGETWYLTLRGGTPAVRRELVMRIPR